MPTPVSDYDLRPIWIAPSWLFWEFNDEGGSRLPRDTARRAHEIHQHACNRLENNPAELDRVDAVTTLWRAVTQRVRALKEVYELRKLPIHPKPKGDMELLSMLEIIRPFMLQRLVDIRNTVEHQDSGPPSLDECLMFADLVWYFLRSTDELVRLKIDAILFEPPDTIASSDEHDPWVELKFGHLSEPPQLRMRLNSPDFTYEQNANWLKIHPNKIESYKEKDDDEVSRFFIGGEIRGTGQQMMQIYRIYFKS